MLLFPVAQTSIITKKDLQREKKKKCNQTHYFEELQIESSIGIPYFFKKIDSYPLTSKSNL